MSEAEPAESCPGRCCAVFYLPWTPNEMRRMAGDMTGTEPRDHAFGYIADMVIPLEYDAAVERMERLYPGKRPLSLFGPRQRAASEDHLYTCRHWDETTRLCGAYESRPDMCRNYPYGEACSHGCGYQVPNVAEVRARYGRSGWSAWRWDRRARGYRLRPGATYEPSETNGDWSWDGEVLRPNLRDDGWRWDARWNKWRKQEAT